MATAWASVSSGWVLELTWAWRSWASLWRQSQTEEQHTGMAGKFIQNWLCKPHADLMLASVVVVLFPGADASLAHLSVSFLATKNRSFCQERDTYKWSLACVGFSVKMMNSQAIITVNPKLVSWLLPPGFRWTIWLWRWMGPVWWESPRASPPPYSGTPQELSSKSSSEDLWFYCSSFDTL